MDGPYNQHLVRDVGSLNLALVVLAFAALVVSTRALARTTAVVWLVNAAPHFIYHLSHLGMHGMAGGDKAGIVVTLGLAVALPTLLLLVTRERSVGAPAVEGAPARSVKV